MHFAEITRLTFLQKNVMGATFSPDGARIAFCGRVDRRIDIYLVDRDGSNLQRLTNGGDGQGALTFFDPHFHPDGRHLICVHCVHEETEDDHACDLYLIDLQSGAGRILTDTHGEAHPAFSPDGHHLVYSSTRMTRHERRPIPEIFRMTWDGQEQTQLTHTAWEEEPWPIRPPRNLFPCYSPDGNFIAFFSSAHGENRYDLYRMRPDGSETLRLTYDSDSDILRAPLWHPDSRHLAISRWSRLEDPRQNKTDLYLVDVDGSEQRCLEESRSIHRLKSFSPDGSLLAFASDRHAPTPDVKKNWDIFLLEMRTGQVHPMTDNAVLDNNPLFSPDGTGLLFTSERNGKPDLYYAEIQC